MSPVTVTLQCFPQVENLLVVVGSAGCDGMVRDGWVHENSGQAKVYELFIENNDYITLTDNFERNYFLHIKQIRLKYDTDEV